eukprot:TRINITY_DN14374_c0_g1_i1.p1 TRINITY_DN14374_c0_g1~~TRINITY_DN14374_c0_g1_i1.p1  ORF type:complete len:400 (-),score=130.91 TRINITY_DN14374_c0_g1_i1:147-1346(-)
MMSKPLTKPETPSRWKYLLSTVLLVGFIAIAWDLKAHQGWGMNLILQIQKWRVRPLDIFMTICSFCGFEFMFVIIPGLMWFGQAKHQHAGMTLFVISSYSLCFIAIIKLIFVENRPIFINSTIARSTTPDIEFSFPSGHAWATSVSWLFFMSRWTEIKRLPIFGVVIITLTSFSRVYFGVHYPHDVLAGAIAGSLTFVFRDWFYVFGSVPEHVGNDTRANRKRHDLFQLFTLACLVLATFYFEAELRKRQPGLFWSFGCILGCFFARRYVRPFVIIKESGAFFWLKFAVRVLIGFLPIGAFTYTVRHMHIKKQDVEVLLFFGGFILAIWTLYLAPIFFTRVGLCRARSRRPSDGELTEICSDDRLDGDAKVFPADRMMPAETAPAAVKRSARIAAQGQR